MNCESGYMGPEGGLTDLAKSEEFLKTVAEELVKRPHLLKKLVEAAIGAALATDVFEVIRKRRSVRNFQDKEIPMEKILKVLDAARWAPSAKNSQPWDFIVVRDPEKKRKLAEMAPFGKFIERAPVLIVVVTDPKKSPTHIIDGACAVENMFLAAQALGLGTCWVDIFDQRRAKELLSIPEHKYILTVVPLGYPAGEPARSTRKPLEECVHLEEFGKRLANPK